MQCGALSFSLSRFLSVSRQKKGGIVPFSRQRSFLFSGGACYTDSIHRILDRQWEEI